jgi:hypothetical protein
MPSPTPTSGKVVLTTKSGTAIYKISADPTITSISNENANAGDSVFIFGTYLKSIQTFIFAGKTITSFNASSSGDTLAFKLPTLSQSGPVTITTQFGTTTTLYNVNDIATGSISNWQWWGGSYYTSGAADFPGNSSQYMVLKTKSLTVGEGNTYSNYAIRMNAKQWIPVANLSDTVGNWAFKFEVSIPQAWDGVTIDIVADDQTYIARWEPWQVTATTTAAYTTNGWRTITIPFTQFRMTDAKLGDGEGDSMTKFSQLVGSTGSSGCIVYMHNYGTSATATGFYGAFDNFRVVKIK